MATEFLNPAPPPSTRADILRALDEVTDPLMARIEVNGEALISGLQDISMGIDVDGGV